MDRTNGGHIIVLVTDVPPLNLGERAGYAEYDKVGYPENIEELGKIWNRKDGDMPELKLRLFAKRLFLFEPMCVIDGRSWDEVTKWRKVCSMPLRKGKLIDASIMDRLCATIHMLRYEFGII